MQQLLPSLLPRPILFAHRGARAHAPENTIEAFALALKLGATGLESDVWVTRDGVAVLDHDGEIRAGWFSKRPIAELRRDQLPSHIPTLAELFAECGDGFSLSLDLKDRSAGPTVIETIRTQAPDALERTWLCHHDIAVLAGLRTTDDRVKLVESTRLTRLPDGPERQAARLAAAGIDGINLRRPDWNGGLVALFHRFELTAFAWDVQYDHDLANVLRMGIDAVYSDHVDRMVDAALAERLLD